MERIELHAKTKYSTDHDSTIDIKNLILKCVENHEKGVAVVDTWDMLAFYKTEKILKELNIKDFKLIYGIELYASYIDLTLKVVVLAKNKNGISRICELIKCYENCYDPTISNNLIKTLELTNILGDKDDLIVGLVYDIKTIDYNILHYFDYVEVNSNISKKVLEKLKNKTTVIYSNRINALNEEEKLSHEVLNNYFKIDDASFRKYKNTKEILKEINDEEIVVANSNKIFDMIENFELLNDDMILPINKNIEIDEHVYEALNCKFKDNIPTNIQKRVEEELKLIHEFNYEGYLYAYINLRDICDDEDEDFIVKDFINNLYIAYLLGITHIDPVVEDLNSDLFFSNSPKISLMISRKLSSEPYHIRGDLFGTPIRYKSTFKASPELLGKMIEKYEKENNLKLSDKKRSIIFNYLEDYPMNNDVLTFKDAIIPLDYNIKNIAPIRCIPIHLESSSYDTPVLEIDYKDIEHKFITLELLESSYLTYLSELKDITKVDFYNCKYDDITILERKEFREYLDRYKNVLVLDDLYEELIASELELVDIYIIMNEITRNHIVSKRTKDLLNEHNIFLRRYHNIDYAIKGEILDKMRIVYELLYFKTYYPKEYYYARLKDCWFDEIIEVISNGYDEILKEIKKYAEYRPQYKYLNLAKELYESSIEFAVEEGNTENNYSFEMDNEKNQITLIIRKNKVFINKILSNDLSLIGSRPLQGKMECMSKVIYELLEQQKKVTLLGFDGPINFYVEHLLTSITRIDKKTIHQYVNPCSCYKSEIKDFSKYDFILGLEYLLEHDIDIKDYDMINNSTIENKKTFSDKLLYFIKESDTDLIIIDRIEKLSDDLEVFLRKLKTISKEKPTKFLIFTNLKLEYEEDKIKSLLSFYNNELWSKYIDNIYILDYDDIIEIK